MTQLDCGRKTTRNAQQDCETASPGPALHSVGRIRKCSSRELGQKGAPFTNRRHRLPSLTEGVTNSGKLPLRLVAPARQMPDSLVSLGHPHRDRVWHGRRPRLASSAFQTDDGTVWCLGHCSPYASAAERSSRTDRAITTGHPYRATSISVLFSAIVSRCSCLNLSIAD